MRPLRRRGGLQVIFDRVELRLDLRAMRTALTASNDPPYNTHFVCTSLGCTKNDVSSQPYLSQSDGFALSVAPLAAVIGERHAQLLHCQVTTHSAGEESGLSYRLESVIRGGVQRLQCRQLLMRAQERHRSFRRGDYL